MKTRKEADSLGQKNVPQNAYYGIQALRAAENFPVSGIRHPLSFIRAYVNIKKAAAKANMQLKTLDENIGKAIVQACEEILSGKHLDQFIVDVFQAGAGTSFNMNVNEVLANRSLELIKKEKGHYEIVSPNDHVNMGQSSNDTFPTALHISILITIKPLLTELAKLENSFQKLARKHQNTIKSGRTHLQDALPVTIADEFAAYAVTLRKCREQLETRSEILLEIALGATAVGTGAGAHPQFKQTAIKELRKMTKLNLKAAENRFEALQSRRAVTAVSSGIRELALELTRIANDLRLLSSGPTSGIAEIILPSMQPGSSIMPGKVNPVMAECLNMIAFQIIGNDTATSMATQAGQLELNVMTPVIMYNTLQSIQLLTNYLPAFRQKCIDGITVDEERCKSYLEKNTSLAVFLSPRIGYLEASKIAQQALKQKRPLKEVAIEKGILKASEAKGIFTPDNLLARRQKKQKDENKP
jgi:aspartate ammonia-lyase